MALRENEKGKVSVHVFYKRQPVTIRKNTIIYEMYDFFTTITKGLLFKDFIEVLSKRFPCEPTTRFNLYLFDIPNSDIAQP